MKKIPEILKHYIVDTSGATAMEYGLLAALLAVGLIAGMTGIGTKVTETWNKVSTQVTSASS